MQSTTSLKRNYRIRLKILCKKARLLLLQSIIKTALCKTKTLLPEDTQISQLFTEHCRGRISEEIISVLENTFDLITISSIFSEITSIS